MPQAENNDQSPIFYSATAQNITRQPKTQHGRGDITHKTENRIALELHP